MAPRVGVAHQCSSAALQISKTAVGEQKPQFRGLARSSIHAPHSATRIHPPFPGLAGKGRRSDFMPSLRTVHAAWFVPIHNRRRVTCRPGLAWSGRARSVLIIRMPSTTNATVITGTSSLHLASHCPPLRNLCTWMAVFRTLRDKDCS